MRQATRSEVARALTAAREYTLHLFDGLRPGQLEVPFAPTVNPPAWELGHVGWFQERWCVRQRADAAPRASRLEDGDRWFDSSQVEHRSRWQLDMPSMAAIRDYLAGVLAATQARLAEAPDTARGLYFFKLALAHELMHAEAFTYTWQALGYAMPARVGALRPFERVGAELTLPGGTLEMGSRADGGFVFDNERRAHPRQIEPFTISPQPVLNAQFVEFIEAGGYREPSWWDPAYYEQIRSEQRVLPRYWARSGGRLIARWFDAAREVVPAAPLVHVSAFEAEAWCRWAGRRLPTEAEWEYAALTDRRFEWGDRVWEWTATPFEPYPGFSADPYRDYSEPWFGDHRVVRGGSFTTAAELRHAKFRNFYRPERGDMFVGFRSCEL